MKKILLDLLDDSAMDQLRAMEKDMKIRILNGADFHLNENRDQIWKELEEYTYENILKRVKENID